MRDIFLADAHLHDSTSANYRRLLDFLADLQGNTRTLFLLGDIFEFWIGYRYTVFSAYVPVLETLRRLRESGTELVYVEGNHDFHLGHYFEQVLGCRVIPDGGEVMLDSRKTFIAHGDLIDSTDVGYRLLRRTLRSRALRWLTGIIPPDAAWQIAHWAGNQSRKGHPDENERQVPRDLLLAHAREHFSRGCDTVITGHFHLPWMQQDDEGTVIALGDWIRQFSYAVYEDGVFRLESY